MMNVFLQNTKKYVWQIGLVGLVVGIFFPAYSSAATLQRPPNNLGLVGYWAFNEGTSTRVIDQSGNGNSGTLIGSPSWTTGKRGKALQFSGNQPFGVGETNIQRVEIPDSTSLRPTTQWTVCGWAYKDVASQSDNATALFWKGNNSSISVEFYFTYIRVNAGGTWGVLNSSVIPANEWVHICVVYDNSAATGSLRFYINGVADSATTGVAEPVHGATSVYIGQRGDHLAHTFKGKIDEVRLYNRALSQSDVSALYRSGQLTMRKVTQQNLLGYWALNERFPSVRVADSSGNGNTGIVRNSANSWSVGARGGGMIFDGNNDFVEMVSTNALEYTGGDLSIAFWMKPASDETDGGRIISKPWSGCGDYNYVVEYGSGQGFGFSLKGATFANLGSTGTAPRDRWSHVVATVDSNKAMKFYLNGVLDNSTTHSITDWTPPGCGDTNTPLTFGTLFPYGEGWAGNTGFSFKGVLDDVRMYSRILSAAEVATMYRQSETTINSSQNNKITNGLVGLWSFNGQDYDSASTTAEALDRSNQGNNGNVVGASPTIGKVGQALRFLNSGSTYVDVPDSSSLDMTTNITMSAWIKLNVLDANNNEILQKFSSYGMKLTSGGKFVGYRWGGPESHESTTTIAPNTWYFVTMTYDGSTHRTYVNGVLENSEADAGTLPVTANNVRIGYATTNLGFNGVIDEMRVYNRTLSAAEIKQLYNMGK